MSRLLVTAPSELVRRDGRTQRRRVALRGGWETDKSVIIIPILLSLVFVGCAIAGPILVVRETNASNVYQVWWWVGIGLCIGAACLLIILIPVWIYILCCD